MSFLSDQDLNSISAAIRAAEARTSGEIVTVLAGASNSYLWPALACAGLVSFLVAGAIAPYVGLVSSSDLFFVQMATLLALGLPLMITRVRFALVPAAVKRAGARRRAREEFFERGLHRTDGRTGILIYASLAERYVEILADDGINAKVEQSDWQAIVDRFVADVRAGAVADGFRTAIARVGDILERHFPATRENPDEFPNRLFVI